MSAPAWLTIPEWAAVRPAGVLCGEGEAPPDTGAPRNVHVLVRGELALPPGTWTLRLSADDYYHAWLDGVWLGQGPAPGAPGRYWYQEYLVQGGRRVTLALHLYYQGLVNRVWNSGDGRFGFWASLVQNGRVLALPPKIWRYTLCAAYSGEIVGYDTQFLEDFDSRLWPEGWEHPGFDDSGWGHPVPALWADYTLARQPTAPLQISTVPPAGRRPVPGGILLDFGRERAGTLCASAVGRAGQRLTLRFGEELDEAGRVRFQLRSSCRYEEAWVFRDGTNVLHQYDYKAFRYVEILGLEQPGVTLVQCSMRERHYPMPEQLCTLACGKDQLEDMFELCKNAVRCGSQEGYLDCPTREKGQYLGDAVITARSQVWLTGKTDLLRKCIGDFLSAAGDFPALLGVAPGSLRQEIADFSLLFPLLPLTGWQFTGELDVLAECYPAVCAMLDAFAVYQRPDGLLENVSHAWNLVDWPEEARDGYDFPLTRPVVGEGCHNVVNALWYGANVLREEMAELLGRPAARRSAEIGNAYRAAFFREKQHLFADSETSGHCSLHANLYAAFFGLLPPESVSAYEALLLTPGRYCGPFPMYFALKGLARLGRYGTLWRLIVRKDEHSWRNMLREGASACFEAWGKDQKWNTSLCHPWASGALPLIIEELAGIQPDPRAPEGFRFEPHLPKGLAGFRLQVPFRGRLLRVEQNETTTSIFQDAVPETVCAPQKQGKGGILKCSTQN